MEQRRTRRFQLQLPLSITRSGAERVALAGTTQDISSCGVLFLAEREPDVGGPIEYIITLHYDDGRAVNLRCMGKVVRSRPMVSPAAALRREPTPFQVAATLERYEFVRA